MDNDELIKQLDAALDLRRSGDFAGALGKFENLEKWSAHPNDIATLRFFQATCLTDLGRADEALSRMFHVDKSQLTLSKRVDYEYERARIERALGQHREALQTVEKALRGVGSASAQFEYRVVSENLETLRGILLAEAGRCDEAIPILDAVPLQDQGWAQAKLLAGDCRYKKRFYREAIDCYMSLISAPKKSHQFYQDAAVRNIGYAYHDLGECETVERVLVELRSHGTCCQSLGMRAIDLRHIETGIPSTYVLL